MTWLLIALGVVLGLPGILNALHLTALVAASVIYREPRPGKVPRLRFMVVIPAHNEEAGLGDTLAAIEAARRPGDVVLVVDDRSTDRTAEIAEERGVLVLKRTPEMKPGRAAARDAGLLHALSIEWDVVAMIDADSIIEPGYFEACEAVFATGAEAVQARSEAGQQHGLVAQMFLAAFALQGVTMPRGRDRLGLVVWLRGTGMAFTRRIAERHGFRGPGASEDGWFSIDLCCDGVLARHVDSARLRSKSAGSLRTASGQQTRWEAGRMIMAREHVGALVRRHDLASLEVALHLLSPPFALTVLSLGLATTLFAVAHANILAVAVFALLVLMAVNLAVGLIQARATLETWLALAIAPAYVLWKLWVQLRALGTVWQRPTYFPPTARD